MGQRHSIKVRTVISKHRGLSTYCSFSMIIGVAWIQMGQRRVIGMAKMIPRVGNGSINKRGRAEHAGVKV